MEAIKTPVVELFGSVVQAVETELLEYLQGLNGENIENIRYLHGSLTEIRATLIEDSQSPSEMYKKYPLVVLVQDFPEKPFNTYHSKAVVNIGIIHCTERELKATERYAKTIKPVLYPIYEELMRQISDSGFFVSKSVSDIVYSAKWDRVNLSKQAFLKMSEGSFDYIDAIEINDLELIVDTQNCLQPITNIFGK